MSELVNSLIKNTTEIGLVHKITPLARVRRFLILGSDSNTYYMNADELTKQNLINILAAIKEDTKGCCQLLIELVKSDNIPRMQTALLLTYLIARHGNGHRRMLLDIDFTEKLFRTPTQVFTFCKFVERIDGKWNRFLKKLVSRYYEKTFSEYHLLKYKAREGFTHRDVLRLCHTKPSEDRADLFKYAVKPEPETVELVPSSLQLARIVKAIHTKRADPVQCLQQVPGLSWEMLPTEVLNTPEVLEQLVFKMPTMAFYRNLRRFINHGVAAAKTRLESEVKRRPDIHPVYILNAWMALKKDGVLPREYDQLLEMCFNQAIGFNLELNSDVRVGLYLDISPSMDSGTVAGTALTPALASLAISLPLLKYSNVKLNAFAGSSSIQRITKRGSFSDIQDTLKTLSSLWSRTDCSLPMVRALQDMEPLDAFIIITDNETNSGIMPSEALRLYREGMRIQSKLIVIAMTSTGFSIADPNDPLSIDIPGFDLSLCSILNRLIKE